MSPDVRSLEHAGLPSLKLRLYGTEEPTPQITLLQAGSLTAELEAGNLRYIRWGNLEILRSIAFIIRDSNWGTCLPEISSLTIDASVDHFVIGYRATVTNGDQRFAYLTHIRGSAEGRLVFSVRGEAIEKFDTNRTGFVVLHPIDGVAGEPVTVEHVDGTFVEGRFPLDIAPFQPMMNLRGLTHRPTPELSVRCLLEGETFEMEDQRNWTDASFKSYARPLDYPTPYKLIAGTPLEQRVTVEIRGRTPITKQRAVGVTVRIGTIEKKMPHIGIGLDRTQIEMAQDNLPLLAQARPAHLICHYDPRCGGDGTSLATMANLARELGAEAWLEAVIVSDTDALSEIENLGETIAEIDQPYKVVLISPAADQKSHPLTSAGRSLATLYQAARRAFPAARIGGGMFSYFAELNRQPPAMQYLDLMTFATSATIHGADDRSVIETLQSIPYVAAKARVIAEGKPFIVGPSAIGARFNPYGSEPKTNPDNIRQAFSVNDPRQRSLLGAAWMLGFASKFSDGGAAALTFGSAIGAFSLIATPTKWPQPYFDVVGGVFPAFHILRGLAIMKDSVRREVKVSDDNRLAALAFIRNEGFEIWLANLTDVSEIVVLDRKIRAAAILNANNFCDAARDPFFLDKLSVPEDIESIKLEPFAVGRLLMD